MIATRSLLLVLTLGLAGGAAFAASPLLEEDFTNTTGKPRNIDVKDYEWASFLGEKGELQRANTAISGGPGNPASPAGFLTASNAPGATRLLVRNLKPALALDGAVLSFRFGANHGQAQVRVVVRVAGRWYASDTVFTTSAPLANSAAFAAAPAASVLKKLPFTRASSAWHALKLDPGAALSRDPAKLSAPLPAGPVIAIGFLLENLHPSWGATAWFDTLRAER